MAEKKHKFRHTVITHHDDGSQSYHHIHEKNKFNAPERGEGDMTGGASNHDDLMDRLMDNLSQPQDGEDRDADNKPYEAPVKVGAKAPVVVGGAPAMRK